MAEALKVPKLGNTVEEVTLVEWLVADGASVTVGQGVLDIETDKALFSVEATADGVIHIGPFRAGDIVPVLQAVAVIGAADDSWQAFAALDQPVPVDSPPVTVAAVAGDEDGGATDEGAQDDGATIEGRIFASPRARKLAATKSVDLAALAGTGPGGRIVERDVLAHLSARPKASPVARRVAEAAGIDVFALAGTGPGGRVTKRDVESALAATAPVPPPPGISLPPSPPLLQPSTRCRSARPPSPEGRARDHCRAHGDERAHDRPRHVDVGSRRYRVRGSSQPSEGQRQRGMGLCARLQRPAGADRGQSTAQVPLYERPPHLRRHRTSGPYQSGHGGGYRARADGSQYQGC